jgi:hypothetical protein
MTKRAREGRVPGLRGLVRRIGEARRDRRRGLDAAAREHGARLLQRRRVGHGGAGADRRRVVAGHVGDGEGEHRRRRGRGGEPAAGDAREMLPHGVHLADVGARAQQRAGERAELVEADGRLRQRQQRRPATGHQHEDEVVRGGRGGEGEHALGRARRARVGHGMRGLDDLDAAAGHAMAVARDDQALDAAGVAVMPLDRGGHRGRGLAGAEHQEPARGQRRQVRRHAEARLGGLDGRAEEPLEEGARRRGHGAEPSPAPRGLGTAAATPVPRSAPEVAARAARC